MHKLASRCRKFKVLQGPMKLPPHFPGLGRILCTHVAQYQLTKYNMTYIFLKKSYTKCSGETIPKLFFKKSKLNKFQSNILYFLFLLWPSRGLLKYIKLRCTPLILPLLEVFWNTKRRLELVFLSQFSHDFWRKIFPMFILSTKQISLPDWLYVLQCWAIMYSNYLLWYIVIKVVTLHNLKLTLAF